MKSPLLFTHTLLLSLFLLLSFSAKAQDSIDITELTGEALHIQLVETALKYDFYNKRCRGVSVSKEVNQVNRLFLKKYGLTVNNFIKEHINRNTRAYQDQVKQQLYKELFELGGCVEAKQKGLVSNFQQTFRHLLEKAETSPWFPLS
ncbi:MAG: hypothetical protein U9R28_08375 [Pseudomonadota bacterium]|nr:hypothetical protein [Pseudomonadota bacterium]